MRCQTTIALCKNMEKTGRL